MVSRNHYFISGEYTTPTLPKEGCMKYITHIGDCQGDCVKSRS